MTQCGSRCWWPRWRGYPQTSSELRGPKGAQHLCWLFEVQGAPLSLTPVVIAMRCSCSAQWFQKFQWCSGEGTKRSLASSERWQHVLAAMSCTCTQNPWGEIRTPGHLLPALESTSANPAARWVFFSGEGQRWSGLRLARAS